MKISFLLAIIASSLSIASDFDGQIDTKAFMQSIKGRYEVLAVNKVRPHNNSAAMVTMDDPDAADWAMPYCMADTCIPGFLNFNYTNTQIFEEKLSDSEVRFLIVFKENNVQKSFIWREKNGNIYFRNPQYELPGNKTADLEHELKKIAD